MVCKRLLGFDYSRDFLSTRPSVENTFLPLPVDNTKTHSRPGRGSAPPETFPIVFPICPWGGCTDSARIEKQKTAPNFFGAGSNQPSSSQNLPAIAVAMTTTRMPAIISVIHIHERPRRNKNRARTDDRGRRDVNHRCRRTDNSSRGIDHRRGARRAPGIRDGIVRGLIIQRVGDHHAGGDAGQDFSDGRPFTITGAGGLQAGNGESKNSYSCDGLFHICLSFSEHGDETGRFRVYSTRAIG